MKKTFKVEKAVKDTTYVAEFDEKVSKATYKTVINKIISGDNFSGLEIMFKHQYIQPTDLTVTNLKSDEFFQERALFFEDLILNFLNFSDVIVYSENTTEEYISLCNKYNAKLITIDLGTKTLYLKPLNRVVFGTLFNHSATNPFDAWEYVYEELIIEESKIDKNSMEYISGFKVVDVLLEIKTNNLKKN